MKRSLLVIVILAQAVALADGGTVQLHKEAGDLVITVFTSPAALSVGTVDLSVLLQKRDGLEPVLDANVSLALNTEALNTEIQAHPTREQAHNKLLYATPVTFTKPGKWRIVVSVERNGTQTQTAGVLEVAPAPERAASYVSYVAFPPAMIVLFLIREQLLRRK